ncbi:PspC domain-containing protein [Paenibacillus arenosi]|uniref:PspC domain-containing protein n=1 Tax=Paenibacillus arenosi TaxID=2774142 RepID=A0ABR9B161_9BACL|nr:PspC domain-containing protein [Paenibacillus arenosi]MBD8499190.1 PspC domain-containing protein [Paenibacillus arenosi]
MQKKFYRSARDSKLCGLCGGLSEYFGFDASFIRILFVLGVVFSGGTLLLAYFLVALVVPKEPKNPYGPYGNQGPHGYYEPNNYNSRTYTPGGDFSNGYGAQQPNGYRNGNEFAGQSYNHSNQSGMNRSSVDSMMEDIEKKAMKREIEQLKERLARYEKGDK